MSDRFLAMITPIDGDHPDQGLPAPPVYPSQRPLWGSGHIDNSLPGAEWPPLPPQLNPPPPAIWPGAPIFALPPNGTLPEEPPAIYPPLPPSVQGRLLVLCWVVGVGHRWIVIDTAAGIDNALPQHPEPK